MSVLRLLDPEAFYVGDAFFDFVDCKGGAEFEDFDVVGFDAGFESGEVNVAGAGSTMVASRELDVVNVKACEVAAQGFEVEDVVDETKVLFDLCVSGVVPIDESGAIDVAEKKLAVRFDGKFFEGLAVFDAKFDAA